MSIITSILRGHDPWCHAMASPVCHVTTDRAFGLNDSVSAETRGRPVFVPGSLSETANFTNPSGKTIHCLQYGEYVGSIPAPHAQPSQCDRVLYTQNTDAGHVVFAEMKITKNPGTKIKQLRETLRQFQCLPEMSEFLAGFATRRCCFFRKTPAGIAGMSAVTAFNRLGGLVAGHTSGYRVRNNQLTSVFQSFQFELWHYSDGDIYDFDVPGVW